MSKSITILFSGGLDSTYLVWKALHDDSVRDIRLLHIELKCNKRKTLVENFQLPIILNLLRKYDKNNKLYHDMNKISLDINNTNTDLLFGQLPAWLLGSLYYNRTDEIWFGYTMNDDMISYIDEVKEIWNSWKQLMDTKTKIVFPLIKEKKSEYVHIVPREIVEETFTCENPYIIYNGKEHSFNECGECITCSRDKYLGIDKYKSKHVSRSKRLEIIKYKKEIEEIERIPKELEESNFSFGIDYGEPSMKNNTIYER